MENIERCYTVPELSRTVGVHPKTIRAWFRHEPGVVKWGDPETRFKRAYESIRIPESVALRVLTRMQQK